MTITSTNRGIEIFYNSNMDKDTAQVTIPDKNGVLHVVQVELRSIPDLEDALLDFEKLFIKTGRKEVMMR